MTGMNPGTGPGTSSYHLLTVLLAYAPNSEAQAAVAMRYNELVMQHGADTRMLDAALAKQIYTDLLDGIKLERDPASVRPSWADRAKLDRGPESTTVPTVRRRSVKAHIEKVFANAPAGTKMLVREIVNTQTPEYPDEGDGPAAGAVVARLFDADGKPRDDIEGVIGCLIDGKKGARKKR